MHKHVAELVSAQQQPQQQQQLAQAGLSNGTPGATEAAAVPATQTIKV